MTHLSFRHRLEQEFQARRDKNPRYSLRAFAAHLRTDHSTLSQILRGTRRISTSQTRAWAKKLGMEREEAAAYLAAGQVPDASSAAREEHVRHWAAEALGIVTGRAHWEILRLCRTATFRPDCRWIAGEIGVTVDEVNIAFSRLLRLRLLEVSTTGEWKDGTGLPALTEREFRELALARVRRTAAEMTRTQQLWPTR